MNRSTISFCFLAALALIFLSCSKENPSGPSGNDNDQGGNTPPIVTAMQDTLVGLGDKVLLHAQATDEDGSVDRFIWAVHGGVFRDTTAEGAISVILSGSGAFHVLVKAVDDKGAESVPDTVKVQVWSSQPGVMLSANTSTTIVGDTVALVAHASDSDGYVATYVWCADGIGCDTTSDSVHNLAWPINGEGERYVSVVAIDEDGLVSEKDSSLITVRLVAPTVAAMSDTTVAVNDTVVLRATGLDSNGTVAAYVWSVDGVSYDTTSGSSYTVLWSISDTGTKTVYVKAVDDDGVESAVDSMTVEVNLIPPSVEAMSDTTVAVNDSVVLHATGSDSNGTVAGYVWSVDGASYDTTSGSSYTVLWSISDYGTKTVYVKAVDDDGVESAVDSMTVEVNLIPPSVEAMSDTTVAVNDSVVLHATGSDSNGTVAGYVWSVDGVSYDTTSGSSYTVLWSISDYGTKTVYVKAVDDDGVESAVDSMTVEVNLIPPSVEAMSDTTVAVNDSVVLHATGSDSNGTVAGYVWSVDGVSYDTTSGSSYTVLWPISDYGTKTVYVKVVDDDGVESQPDSISVEVKLFPPVIEQIGDTTVAGGGNLAVTISADDSNGTIEKYYWSWGATGWSDSAEANETAYRSVSRASGSLTVVVGARDDDGLLATDTFTVTFDAGIQITVADSILTLGSWKSSTYGSALDIETFSVYGANEGRANAAAVDIWYSTRKDGSACLMSPQTAATLGFSPKSWSVTNGTTFKATELDAITYDAITQHAEIESVYVNLSGAEELSACVTVDDIVAVKTVDGTYALIRVDSLTAGDAGSITVKVLTGLP